MERRSADQVVLEAHTSKEAARTNTSPQKKAWRRQQRAAMKTQKKTDEELVEDGFSRTSFTLRSVYLQTTVTSSSLSPKELISQLDQEGYHRAYVDGGETIQRFLEDGLIDELQLTRIPVLLGAGIPLFSNTGRKLSLKHLATNAYSNGMVMTSYRVLNNNKTT